MSESNKGVLLQDSVALESYTEEFIWRVNTDVLPLGSPTNIRLVHEVELPTEESGSTSWFTYLVNGDVVGEGYSSKEAAVEAADTLFNMGYSRLAVVVEYIQSTAEKGE